MNKKFLPLLIVLFSVHYLYGQAPPIINETWVEKPLIHTLDDKYSKESAVILSDSRRIEFTDESKDNVTEYYTLHKIIHINDDRGIENFNKIYLGINEKADIVSIKARTILSGGKIIELDKDDIKEILKSEGLFWKFTDPRPEQADKRLHFKA